MNEVLQAIKERRSIRRFKAEQVKDEELNTVLEAGTWAPTGHGSQDPWIVAVQNSGQRATLSKANAEIMAMLRSWARRVIPSTVRPRRSMSLRPRTMRTMSRMAVSCWAR